AYEGVDIVIKAAAVADYRPHKMAENKIKKNEDSISLDLDKNPDILKELGSLKKHQILVGFAAETQNVEEYAKKKISEKNLDLIVANDVTAPGAGFSVDTNIVKIIDPKGGTVELEQMTKEQVAHEILDNVLTLKKRE
ncbi:MAG: bifunctional 4'-phosphopantothenoylcysteine decarboxylase/phosphopantothenoylcysteine synthetase, partial [Acidaminococcaceae bacterium]|nr:bifunctional 4'-phosphopantothenoylcysteine decarboxylase/phosphopantothenoylcysteine synthetase [Acidaminococcaceae bacterium]